MMVDALVYTHIDYVSTEGCSFLKDEISSSTVLITLYNYVELYPSNVYVT